MNEIYLILGIGLIVIVTLFILFSGQSGVNSALKSDIKSKLSKLEKRSQTENISELRDLLISTDKLLDYTLKELNVRGETMGLRLKNVRNKMSKSTYNYIWEAHKIRNQLVHEFEYTPSRGVLLKGYRDLKRGINEVIN